jgi:adenylosuccinate lyase
MLTAISPIDGRYASKTEALSAYCSEFALIKYRVYVEIEYFIALCEIPLPQLESFDKSKFSDLRKVAIHLNVADAQQIKDIEKVTNHDVKAVEYFIKEQFDKLGISEYKEFVHFGLTSQDVNNTAVPLSLKHAMEHVCYPAFEEMIALLRQFANDWKHIPMLAKTHGQPASPTILGKEFMVFVERLETQFTQMKQVPFSAKFGGATGNLNAHKVTYPTIDWVSFANNFVNNRLHLKRSQFTTQIEHYDNLAALFDGFARFNTILIGLIFPWNILSKKS